MDTIEKVKALVTALMGSNSQRPTVQTLPQIPQNGLANRAQQTVQNRSAQLARQIAEQGG